MNNVRLHQVSVVISVTGMARRLGMSRSHFYDLMSAGVFPPPSRRAGDGRPFFTVEQQLICLDVRRQNVGVNGKPILFYQTRKRPRSKRKSDHSPAKRAIALEYRPIVAAVRSLGATDVSQAQIVDVIEGLFPTGVGEASLATVVTTVFLKLQRSLSEVSRPT